MKQLQRISLDNRDVWKHPLPSLQGRTNQGEPTMKYISLLLLLIAPSFVFSQEITSSSVNVVVVLDDSGSMDATMSNGQRRMDVAKNSLIQVISQVPSNSKVGVYALNRGWIYDLKKINQDEFQKAVNNVHATGGTPLGRSMTEGANALIDLRSKQHYGVYRLLVVTDGESSDNVDKPLLGKFGILSKGVQVEAIGVDMDADHSLATKVPYRNANDPESLKQAIAAVFAETSSDDYGGENPFEIIEPIPDKLAASALVALSTPDNAHVGQKPLVDESGNIVVDENGNVVYEEGEEDGGSGIMGVLLTIFVIVVVIVVLFGVMCRSGSRY